MQDYYKILGISRTADTAEVRRAFKQKAKLYHPDLNNDSRAQVIFQKLNEAYQVLQNHEKRLQYDQRLQNGFPAATTYYRPGKVKYRAKGDKYAHYESMNQANEENDRFEKYFDISLFVFMFCLGCFGFFYGLYRLWVRPEEHINPYPGIIMGILFTGIITLFWRNKGRFLNN